MQVINKSLIPAGDEVEKSALTIRSLKIEMPPHFMFRYFKTNFIYPIALESPKDFSLFLEQINKKLYSVFLLLVGCLPATKNHPFLEITKPKQKQRKYLNPRSLLFLNFLKYFQGFSPYLGMTNHTH